MEIFERVSDTRKLVLKVNGENVRRGLPDNLNRGGDPKGERVEQFGDNCHRRCPRSEDRFSGVTFTVRETGGYDRGSLKWSAM